ncbi:DUF6453 family protein [Serratia symbiotica]|uniref:Uncharacterized protein n=1 Tax=Serratia symbiotica SCt-VLC TaxID=1347341 RepID=A0A068R9A3_9GAMM|nr:DUF6453 family protein [Serratia symbiotica]MBQ0957006.1 hypothetical protein [Serratia symbiotica]CDG46884.1 hypothetical protein SCTVLC_0096 [Serratia symbiotica SCt-VLC]
MSIGIFVQPDDNLKMVDITNGAKTAAYRGFFAPELDADGDGWMTVESSPNAQIFFIPRNTVAIRRPQNSVAIYVAKIDGIYYQGNQVYKLDSNLSRLQGPTAPFGLDAFEILGTQAGNFGLFLQNATDFTAITDIGVCGFVVWRGTVNVTGEWSIPDDIPNRDSCIVFANWNRGDRTVYFERDSMTVQVCREQGDQVINDNLAECLINLCIVATGFEPKPPSSGYGIVIRNSEGRITYSSKYPPLMFRNMKFLVDRIPGNYVTLSGTEKPMIPLCCVGSQRSEEIFNGNYRNIYQCGFKMMGNAVTVWRAFLQASYDGNYSSFEFEVCPQPLPYIDANDYF